MIRIRFVVTAAVLAVLCSFAAAAPAGAQVVPFKSIDGVRIGWNEKKVLKKLGAPTGREETAPDSLTLTYRARKLTVFLASGKVASVRTTSKSEVSPTGIKVGLSYADAKEKLVGADCFRNNGSRFCFVYREGYTFSFEARRGKVVALEVGQLLD